MTILTIKYQFCVVTSLVLKQLLIFFFKYIQMVFKECIFSSLKIVTQNQINFVRILYFYNPSLIGLYDFKI